MSRVIEFEEGRLLIAAKRGYRNWRNRFRGEFGLKTQLSQISLEPLTYLAQGKEKATFYLYDLIMNLHDLGSGFEFDGLSPRHKILVIDRYLFLLDRIRFEYMKRLGWLRSYPGEENTLVELITQFDKLAPSLQAKVPVLSQAHPSYRLYCAMSTFDREVLVRKLIPKALKEMGGYSTTL